MKYRIVFKAARKGGLNPHATELVDRIVEADSIEQARLCAYETHEHIGAPFGRFILIERVPQPVEFQHDKPPTEE